MGAVIYEGRPEEIVDYNLISPTGATYTPDKYVEVVFKPHLFSIWMAKWVTPEGVAIAPAKMAYIKGTAKQRLEAAGWKIAPRGGGA